MTRQPITYRDFLGKVVPILRNCRTPNLRAVMCKQLWTKGMVTTPYGEAPLYKLRERWLNYEYAQFIQDLRDASPGPEGLSTRELYPRKAGKASSDGVYCVMLGYIKIVGRDSRGKPRYALTPAGERVLIGRSRMPERFVYIDYDGVRSLIAVSRRQISLQSLGGVVGGRVSLFHSGKSADFQLTGEKHA